VARQISPQHGVEGDAVASGLASLIEKKVRDRPGPLLPALQRPERIFERDTDRNAQADEVVGVTDLRIGHGLDTGEDRAFQLRKSSRQLVGKRGAGADSRQDRGGVGARPPRRSAVNAQVNLEGSSMQ
jgi:hypothetical protein